MPTASPGRPRRRLVLLGVARPAARRLLPGQGVDQLAQDRGSRRVLREHPGRRPGGRRPGLRRQGRGQVPERSAGARPHRLTGHPTTCWRGSTARLEDVHDAGDHYIVIGRVHELEVERERHPLIFFRGGYGSFDVLSVPIYALGDDEPDIDPTAYVHPDAVIIGRVRIGAESTVWPGPCCGATTATSSSEPRTSIQDGTVIHTTAVMPTTVAGPLRDRPQRPPRGLHHRGRRSLVGSGSVVLHRAIVRTGSLVGANALVPGGMEVPTGAMALGVPARLREDAVVPGQFEPAVVGYVERGRRFRDELRRLDLVRRAILEGERAFGRFRGDGASVRWTTRVRTTTVGASSPTPCGPSGGASPRGRRRPAVDRRQGRRPAPGADRHRPGHRGRGQRGAAVRGPSPSPAPASWPPPSPASAATWPSGRAAGPRPALAGPPVRPPAAPALRVPRPERRPAS